MKISIPLKVAILNSGLKQRFIASKAKINQVRLSKIINGYIEPTKKESKRLLRF